MPPEPIRYDSAGVDLHHRFQHYATVDASPQAGTETVIATLTLADFGDITIVAGVQLRGWAAYTVGTSGDAVTLKIRHTDASGTVVATSGATTATATDLDAKSVEGFDPVPGFGVYALTMLVHSGAAASTVSALLLSAILV